MKKKKQTELEKALEIFNLKEFHKLIFLLTLHYNKLPSLFKKGSGLSVSMTNEEQKNYKMKYRYEVKVDSFEINTFCIEVKDYKRGFNDYYYFRNQN